MAFLSSLVLFCLCCFASDVVELEPVNSAIELEPVQSGKYDCNLLTSTTCNTSPYCHWNNTDCVDDPCLLVVNAGTPCNPDPGTALQCGTGPGNNAPATIATNQDCVGGSGSFCKSPNKNNNLYDYCFWAQLRDGSCPSTVCKLVDKKCVSNSGVSSCTVLAEADCKMVPKCLWKSPQGCFIDPCFNGSLDHQCDTWTGFANPENKPDSANPVLAKDCVQYQPYKSDGTVSHYCVYKEYNAKPNLCYFLSGDSDPNSVTDYGATYPTYSTIPSSLPTCTGTISGCDDNPSGLCTTKINSKGGLAGLYCGDKDHGAASILHIPSLVVFLLASIFVSKFTL